MNNGLKSDIIEWTENAYIKTNVSAGTIVSLTPSTLSGYRCAVVSCEQGDRFIINTVGKSTPRAWAFLDGTNAMLTVSPSMKTFTDYLLIAPENAAKLVLNDAPVDGNFNTTSFKGGCTAADISALTNDIINIYNGNYGGDNFAFFEQGSASFTNGILTPSNNDVTVRSYRLRATFLHKNDKLVISSGFKMLVVQVRDTVAGYERIQNITNGYAEGTVDIPNAGLYVFILRKTDDSIIIPKDANAAVAIHHHPITKEAVELNLPKNPYRNIVWSRIQEKTSVSHAHCTEQSQFDALKSKYDHIAISNYHPSIPYYPLSNYFERMEFYHPQMLNTISLMMRHQVFT